VKKDAAKAGKKHHGKHHDAKKVESTPAADAAPAAKK
jgi:hypothetical protein